MLSAKSWEEAHINVRNFKNYGTQTSSTLVYARLWRSIILEAVCYHCFAYFSMRVHRQATLVTADDPVL